MAGVARHTAADKLQEARAPQRRRTLRLQKDCGNNADYFTSHNDSHVAASSALIMMNLLLFPVSMISVGMLSLAYRHFFESGARERRLLVRPSYTN